MSLFHLDPDGRPTPPTPRRPAPFITTLPPLPPLPDEPRATSPVPTAAELCPDCGTPFTVWRDRERAAGRRTRPGPQPMNAGVTPGGSQ